MGRFLGMFRIIFYYPLKHISLSLSLHLDRSYSLHSSQCANFNPVAICLSLPLLRDLYTIMCGFLSCLALYPCLYILSKCYAFVQVKVAKNEGHELKDLCLLNAWKDHVICWLPTKSIKRRRLVVIIYPIGICGCLKYG